jgi:hypothetical protein
MVRDGPRRPWPGGTVFATASITHAASSRSHAWTAGHARDHIGGTTQPVQTTPRFSPFYVEFDEYQGYVYPIFT